VAQKTERLTEVKVYLDEETMSDLDRLREIWSHAMPHATIADILKRALGEAIEKHDPLKKVERSEVRAKKSQSRTTRATRESAAPSQTQMPSQTPALGLKLTKTQVRFAVWKRDQSRCTFVDPRDGQRCAAKRFVEEDHVVPKAVGGEFTVENIRLRCRTHNQRHAIDCYGIEKMKAYIQ
jgi:hypothetical protein